MRKANDLEKRRDGRGEKGKTTRATLPEETTIWTNGPINSYTYVN